MNLRPLSLRLLASLFACVLLPAIAKGQTLVLNASDNLSTGSLRVALSQALPGSTITFSPAIAGQTIQLESGALKGELVIAKNITLDASNLPGGITIAAPTSGGRVLRIDGTIARRTVTLRGITLKGGNIIPAASPNQGGGIYAFNATLTLEQCLVEGNTAANGGGIGILGSSVSDRSTLILRNTTVHGNRVETLFPSGGGMYLQRCDATLIHSTVTGNTGKYLNANGSINTAYPNPSVDTAGGIRVVHGSLTLENSVVAGNGPSFVGAYGDDILARAEDTATLALSGNNLIREADGHLIPSGASVLRIDPKLGPLQNNGGPTLSRLPALDSPLVNATGTLPLATDQRGLPRPSLGGIDIGAVELQGILVTTNADSGPGSLRQAIADAPAGFLIAFAPVLSGQTITLTTGQLLFDKNLNIDASTLPAGLTINANNASRIFEITSGNTVDLHSLTLTGGSAFGDFTGNQGGAILNSGTLTLTNSTLSGNSAGSNGGGIYNNSDSTLTLTNSTLSGNSAYQGGGIYNFGMLTLTNSTLSGNSAGSNGGGIYNFVGCTLTLTNSIVAANSSSSLGPDIRQLGTISAEGANLLSNLANSGLSAGPNVLVAAPLLAPLGDYGGPTQTMPPLPGSLAIDAPGTINPGVTDQRGFPRFVGGALDIGAVESQGNSSDLALFWNTDWDGDGKTFGIEFATASDPLVADIGAPGDLTGPFPDPLMGDISVGFDVNPQAVGSLVWKLQHSPDLSAGSWRTLFLLDNPYNPTNWEVELDIGISVTNSNPARATVADNRTPATKGFYRLAAEIATP